MTRPHFGNPALTDTNDNSVRSILGRLPTLRWVVRGLTHNERHLVYPPTDAEQPAIFAVPASYLEKAPPWYAWGDIPHTTGILEQLLALLQMLERAGTMTGRIVAAVRRPAAPRQRPDVDGSDVRPNEAWRSTARFQPRW